MQDMYGQIFAQTAEKMEEICSILVENGYIVSYISQQTANIIKEVPDELRNSQA